MIILREDNISDVTKSKELICKENEYMEYIEEHRKNVRDSFADLFCNKKIELRFPKIIPYVDKARLVIPEHDASKFSDEEFYDYRVKYYPTLEEQDKINTDEIYASIVEENYNKAWLHHFSHNNHHPEYWKCENLQFQENATPKDMSLDAIIHMICDWEAMSRKFHTNTYQWYKEQCDCKQHMSERTIKNLEILLDFLYT